MLVLLEGFDFFLPSRSKKSLMDKKENDKVEKKQEKKERESGSVSYSHLPKQ